MNRMLLGMAAIAVLLPVGVAQAQTAPKKLSFTVNANKSWQDTGVVVDGKSRVSIRYVSGNWTANPATGMVSADGNPRYVAKPGYALPGAREGALLGRVNGRPFLVGSATIVPAGLQGPGARLELAINDDVAGRYGRGLQDNVGALTVEITVQPAATPAAPAR